MSAASFRCAASVLSWGLAALLLAVGAAQASDSPAQDFGRIAAATRKLTYSGTFVYQSLGSNAETSRVAHVQDGAGERERLEVLDGSPREVLRINGEVRCYLPDQKLVIVERQGRKSFLPVQLPETLAQLEENYHLKAAGLERVAGRSARLYVLEPKDDLRFAHVLWVDADTGLLLKARMVDAKGETLEQFAFTQVRIGGPLEKDALQPRLQAAAAQWETRSSTAVETPAMSWNLAQPLPGFRRTASVKRHLRNESAETLQMVFSDGMVSVSVFIEALNTKEVPAPAMFAAGATQFYKRVQGRHVLTVMGEVPAQTLRRLGDNLQPPRP